MTKIELTRRRVLGGLVTIGAGSAAAGAGTFALFSDTETDSGTASAGTLDLAVGANTGQLSFSATDIAPTDTGTASTDLTKSGTVPADLTVKVTSVSGTEGTNSNSETNTDTADGSELVDQLELNIWLGTGGESDTSFGSGDIVLNSDGTTGSTKNFEVAANYDGATWGDVISGFSGPVTLNIDWDFPNAGNNNDAQGDTFSIDFEIELIQQ